jgi:hypothetical protein
MKGIEDQIEARLAVLGVGINAHTFKASETLGTSIHQHVDQRFDAPSESQETLHNYMLEQL